MQTTFTLSDFSRKPPFSSFLPGIAGPRGIPMWVFYVNRGQAIASFGVQDKNHPLLEFQPANKAYQQTPLMGFRSFLKVGGTFYEPFSPWQAQDVQRTMHIDLNELTLTEVHASLGLEVHVHYFTLPGMPIAALVRTVTLHNRTPAPLALEWLDGLPRLIPYGADNGVLKHISNTIEAWMQVEDHLSGIPFYRLKASAADRAEVRQIQAGNFALASLTTSEGSGLLPIIVDPEVVFAHDTSLQQPVGFLHRPLKDLLSAPQATAGKTPAAFFATTLTLPAKGSIRLQAVFGNTSNRAALQSLVPYLSDPAHLEAKRVEARTLTQRLTDHIATHSAKPRFDGYVRQTFLDNVLRGGWPMVLGPHVYHIYSRKHGDMERDYNDFYLAPEYYSQGNGNFRDVAQNRRNDVWFEPRVRDFNIRQMLSLLQTDGYNPLVLQGIRFRLSAQAIEALLKHTESPESLRPHLEAPFTPGKLLKAIEDYAIPLDLPADDFLQATLAQAETDFAATFGEGFWIDHWTYLLDLIESYAGVYPEALSGLLHEIRLPYFESPAVVRPRRERYVLTEKGVRQYHAVAHDAEKAARIIDRGDPWLRTADGKRFYTTVAEKLLLLSVLKFSSRDPWGMGVEMEAGKPGWYDALNGLPGLLGSSMNETYELLRLLRFLKAALTAEGTKTFALPCEADDLLQAVVAAAEESGTESDLTGWNQRHTALETYRARTHLGFSGEMVTRSAEAWRDLLDHMIARVNAGIQRAQALSSDLPVTYFAWEVRDYAFQSQADGQPRRDEEGRPYVWPRALRPRPLPPFLEGAVRAMKVKTPNEARQLHRQVLASPLWDATLGMFKVNANLANEAHEIGRARAFPPGWLENESIWLHMHYKYLLELLKQGLFEEFFALARNALIPFRDPEQYGRSPLENSSFLASSAHPNASLHGRGFVARLSGATAEFLHIWLLMTTGAQPFVWQADGLHLRLRPALPGWLFDNEGRFTFTLLGHCRIVLHNPSHRDLFPGRAVRIVVHTAEGAQTIPGPDLPAPYAQAVRSGEISHLEFFFPTEAEA